MALSSIIKNARAFLKKVNNVVNESVAIMRDAAMKARPKFRDDIRQMFSGLKITSDGKIDSNTANMNKLRDIEEEVRKLTRGTVYTKGVQDYAQKTNKITEFVADEYSFDLADLLKSKANQDSNNAIVNNLTGRPMITTITDDVTSILNKAVNESRPVDELLKDFDDYAMTDGGILNRIDLISTDTAVEKGRVLIYETMRGASRGEKFYFLYEGPDDELIREFCADLVGKLYTKERVESWARQDWHGKKAGTNELTIFKYCGGYNCRHTLLPVKESQIGSNQSLIQP